MSTIKSSAENLTLNADGSNNDIIFQSNGSNIATLDQAGLLTATTFAGSGASLTALPSAQLTGSLPAISGASLTGLTSAQMPTGSVLQVVHNYAAAVTSIGGSNPNAWITLVSQAITPSSTSSKIMVLASGASGNFDGGSHSLYTKLLRDSTLISGDNILWSVRDTGGNSGGSNSINDLDSPSTTSATTYYLQGKTQDNKAANGYFTHITITLMEIAG